MLRRLALIFSVFAMGRLLNGCTICGPIWDDWLQVAEVLQVGTIFSAHGDGFGVTKRAWRRRLRDAILSKNTGGIP